MITIFSQNFLDVFFCACYTWGYCKYLIINYYFYITFAPIVSTNTYLNMFISLANAICAIVRLFSWLPYNMLTIF